jgi:hypothetical protein
MLSARNINFTGFARSPSKNETLKSLEGSVSAASPEALEKAAASSKQKELALRTELKTTSDLYGSFNNTQIFVKGDIKPKLLKEFLTSPNIIFDPNKAPGEEMGRKLEIMAGAVNRVQTGLANAKRTTPPPNGSMSFTSDGNTTTNATAVARFDLLTTSLSKALRSADILKGLEIAAEEQKKLATLIRENSAKVAQIEGYRPANFKNDVRRSVEALVSEYARRVTDGEEVTTFVNSFIFRRIATLPESIGNNAAPDDNIQSPLGASAGGNAPVPAGVTKKNGTTAVSQPKEPALPTKPTSIPPQPSGLVPSMFRRKGGFYSLSFGTEQIPELNLAVQSLTSDGKAIKGSDVLDPRPERLKQILKYKAEVDRGAALG